ncbi:MAG: undecaprenyl-diphosphate phosphatase [Micrococcales bacterium]|nr:undecaprenyl-diphosphate phosphatase [Micrococcales bacterium]
MQLFDAIILGLVQGLTEFLPISSSAHLRVIGELLGIGGDPGARFTAIVQLGTETAVLVYFRRDLARIAATWARSLARTQLRRDPDARLGWFIILGSIPIIVLGLLLQDQIETVFRSLWIVAGTLIVFGLILGFADALSRSTRTVKDLTWPHAIGFGLAQSLALVPGVSRSGGTITMGRILGYERAAAARYSFLLALPAVFGSGLYELAKAVTEPCTRAAAAARSCTPEIFSPVETAVATLVAGLVGFAVIHLFLRYISHRSFLPFVLYRVGAGVLLIILLLTGVLSASA